MNYLYDYNNKQSEIGGDDHWYIYFLGGTVTDLKHIKDETETIDESYLKELNEQLATINESSDTVVYVAFTLYDQEITTPLFPKDYTTLSAQKRYIEEYFGGNSTKEVKQFSIFSKDYRDVLKDIYEHSWLFNLTKDNVILPFSMRSTRKINDKTDESNIYKRTYDTYTLYAPSITPDFDKAAFKKLFEEKEAIHGTSAIEQKMERVVGAIDDYFIYGKRPETLPCENQLASDNYKNLVTRLGKDDTWVQVIDENPCILDEMYSAGDDCIEASSIKFEKDLALFVCAPLYGALAIPAFSIMGPVAVEELAKELFRKYGREKLLDAGKAIAVEVALQYSMNFYFDPEINVLEGNERHEAAILKLQFDDIVTAVMSSLNDFDMPTEITLACLSGGVDLDLETIKNPETFLSEFNFETCAKNAVYIRSFKCAGKERH